MVGRAAEYLHDCIHVFIPALLRFGHVALATVKCVNHGSEYGLKIFANIYLYGPEKFIKLAKK